jgi:hypothetical protein
MNPLQPPRNPQHALIFGAMWTIGTRWAVKAVGFINTIVVARFIAPKDYVLRPSKSKVKRPPGAQDH